MRMPGLVSATRLRRGVDDLPLRQGPTERIAHEVQGLEGAHVLPLRRQGTCDGACTGLLNQRRRGMIAIQAKAGEAFQRRP